MVGGWGEGLYKNAIDINLESLCTAPHHSRYLKKIVSFFENTVDPDQLASDGTIGSGSTLFSTLIEMRIQGPHEQDKKIGEEC